MPSAPHPLFRAFIAAARAQKGGEQDDGAGGSGRGSERGVNSGSGLSARSDVDVKHVAYVRTSIEARHHRKISRAGRHGLA